ncbi:MAG TPA: M48 family metallopeptidase [Nitrospiraceae bacterium]|jgi:Zn-dependent protease with chaperone function
MTSNPPNALCFGHEFPATGAPCFVELSTTGLTLHFTVPSSFAKKSTVPFAGMTVSAGGLDHNQLVVQWDENSSARTLYLKDPSIIRLFRQMAPPELTHHLEAAAAKVRQARTHGRRIWYVAICALTSVLLILWLGSDWLVEMAVDRIPVEWEQKLGESAYHDFLAEQDVLKEGPAVAAMYEITQRLTQQITTNPYKFDISVVKSDVVNAFALPGGYIVVFTGLIKKADSGEEVAGVLSHEVTHVLKRHGLNRIIKNLGLVTVVAIIVGDPRGFGGLVKQVGLDLLTLKFGRAQETEADVQGLQLLQRAKIDPSGMIRFFERLAEKDQGRMEWLSTHPMSAARADLLKIELATLTKQSFEPFSFEWSTIRASLGIQPESKP